MWQRLEGTLWFIALVSFVLAGIASSPKLLIGLGVAGIGATLVAVPLHFVEAWRKVNAVPNKREYTLWVAHAAFS